MKILQKNKRQLWLMLMVCFQFLSEGAFAGTKYIAVFKSQSGFDKMSQIMMSSGKEVFDFKSTVFLPGLRTLIFETSSQGLLTSLSTHPEIKFIEADRAIRRYDLGEDQEISKLNSFDLDQGAQFSRIVIPQIQVHGQLKQNYGWNISAITAPGAWPLLENTTPARAMILDGGMDLSHPALKNKVEKTKDFAKTFYPVSGLLADSHGTMVAGFLAGGSTLESETVGVAPMVKLLIGRVCESAQCEVSAILQGMNWAVEEKVDVVSMSFGDFESGGAFAEAIQSLEDAGVVVVAAAGNGALTSGYEGLCPENQEVPVNCGIHYPANFASVVSVGAITPQLIRSDYSQWSRKLTLTAPADDLIRHAPFNFFKTSRFKIKINDSWQTFPSVAILGDLLASGSIFGSEIIDVGLGNEEDYSEKNVTGKTIIVFRGGVLTRREKLQIAANHKVAATIMVNNVPGLFEAKDSYFISERKMPSILIESTTGELIKSIIQDGHSVDYGFEISDPEDPYYVFRNIGGTSAATPHVAGVAAMMRSVNPNLSPAEVRLILSLTAKQIQPAGSLEYGLGLVQAKHAVELAGQWDYLKKIQDVKVLKK